MRFTPYSPEIERFRQQLDVSLSEHDRRRYAAIEASSWATAGFSISPNSLAAPRKRFGAG
jgi:hypothetical protein